MYKDRKDAGKRLALALYKYKGTRALVLAIPRGGVEIGYQVASELDLDLSVVIARKLPFPDQPEAGFGAIAEDGSAYVQEEVLSWLDPDTVEKITHAQKQETERRKKLYRRGEPLPDIEGRHVILVDDGIAMGSTVRACVLLLRNCKAGWVTIASPVAGPETAQSLEEIADEVIILERPSFFRAVAQVYQDWYDVPDEEVINILRKWEKQRIKVEKGQ